MTEIKKPDLTAPRFRPTRYNVSDDNFCTKFRKKYPQYKDLSDKKIRSIIKDFNEHIYNGIIENRDGIELPENLGFIFIGTCNPPKKFNTNYTASIEHDKRLKHRNFESDSFIAKIFYTNFASKYRFQNRELWQFKGCRDFTRKTSEAYKKNWKKYIQVENFANISDLFKKTIKRDKVMRKGKVKEDNYNEFEID